MATKKTKQNADALSKLGVIDTLEVGPVQVQPARLVMPYKVHQGKAEHEFNLIYRWEESVFEPQTPWAQNLASFIGAQVALNYGLFCNRLVFHGPFDHHDQTLLREMASNTAREIFVNKLLMPNPFLKDAATEFEPTRRRSYLLAELEFPDRIRGRKTTDLKPWEGSFDHVAVLSSGGKDSLLSYGLLRETGAEVHPIFINESGRHWFTALNAHRAFERRDPSTARVWTNADRLFTWMLRRLPFVRQDFSKLRSDDYPIRLWTVAVFLAGALPLLRKRGIARLVIGNEFDTTLRQVHHGIRHYGGLFDQSRFFDQSLSRFFHKKGFGVSQFSVLRPLSELLIEKTLAERYPDLLRLQVSCHATHKDGDRMRPCGRCEKCRRIVGILLALGVEPSACGYDPEQVVWCLDKLVSTGVHQEDVSAAHMGFLLRQQGLLHGSSLGEIAVRERPEVMHLRFDSEHSPFDAIPVDLREPILKILLKHADGAKKRVGRVWKKIDPLSSPELQKPYPFEKPPGAKIVASQSARPDKEPLKEYLLAHLSWPEAEVRFKEVDLALLPVGAIEQHGPHLPLDTDAFDADYLARKVVEACSRPRPLVLPLIPYGVSYHHEDFKGTISLSPRTLSQMVYEVGMGAARNGITKLVIVNGHGGNAPALKYAAQMINAEARIFTCVDTGESSDADLAKLTETAGDVHAGEVETSTCLAIRPHLVHMDRATTYVPKFSSRYLDFSSKRSVEWFTRTAQLSESGVLGDPSKASSEKGQRMWAVMIKNLVEFVEQLKGMSLDEIYQRRY